MQLVRLTSAVVTIGFAGAVAFGVSSRVEGRDVQADGPKDAAVAQRRSSGVLFPGAKFPTGGLRPDAIGVGDFNEDGTQDLVVTDQQNALSFLLGRGDGAFEAPQLIPLTSRATAIEVVDLDADGHLDVVGVGTTASVHVVLGNGDGSFVTAQEFVLPGGNARGALVIADVDQNGFLDVAVPVASPDGKLDVVFATSRGMGVGTLLSGVPGRTIASGDFDGNGLVDLVVGDFVTDKIWVLIGLGGTSYAIREHDASHREGRMQVADVTGDGAQDLVYEDLQFQAMAGAGDGTLGEPFALVDTFANADSWTLTDFDSDGLLDLLWSWDAGVRIHFGERSGKFAPPVNHPMWREGTDFAVADFNGDNHRDIAAVNATFQYGHVTLLFGRGNGGVYGPDRSSTVGSIGELAVADWDGDGSVDVAASRFDVEGEGLSSEVNFWRGTPGGAPEVAASFVHSGAVGFVAQGDWNGDHWPDLALADAGTNEVFVYPNTGAGVSDFGAPTVVSVTGVNAFASSATGADVNGDGALDLLVGGTQVDVALGSGDGSFLAPEYYLAGVGKTRIAVGDLNGDGAHDIVGNSGWMLAGDGAGAFAFPEFVGAGWPSDGDVALGDLNGDGALDIVLAGIAGGHRIFQLGDGSLGLPQEFAAGFRPLRVRVGDVDRDGDLDVVTVSQFEMEFPPINFVEPGEIAIAMGDGHGGLDPASTFATGDEPSALVLADVDLDGWLDVLVGTAHNPELRTHRHAETP